jgi:hypothetical protein
MREFYIYSGEAGRKVLTWVLRCYSNSSWPAKTLTECVSLLAIDQENIELGLIYPRGFSNTGNQTKITDVKNRLLRVMNLDPNAATTGVGKIWPRGETVAEAKFKEFAESASFYQKEIGLSDHLHISHSGGGGIGCGSGPVFSRGFHEINKSNYANRRKAVTASIFLPREYREPLEAVPNTCSTIGNHSESCNAIFLFDPTCARKWQQYSGSLIPENDGDDYWVVDFSAAEMQLVLASLNNRVYMKSEKNFEGADLITFSKNTMGGGCSLIAPCYAEYPVSILDNLKFKVLVKDLFTRRALMEYSPNAPAQRVGLFCIFPARFANAQLNLQMEKGWMKEIMPSVIDPDWTFFYYSNDLSDKIKMLGLIVNPHMPRLHHMLAEFKDQLNKWEANKTLESQDFKRYKESCNVYENYLATTLG